MLFDTSHGVVETLSFDNFTEAIELAPINDANSPAKRGTYAGKLDASFYGVSSIDEAISLATNGWPEGRDKFAAIADGINVQSHILKRRRRYDVYGSGSVDMGRASTGQPDCVMRWINTNEKSDRPNGKVVKILFNCVTSGMVSTKIIETRGAATIALVDALETAGYRVELDVLYYIGANNSKHVHKILVPLKKLDYALQLDQMIYALAHPSFMRVFMFSLLLLAGKHGKSSASIGCGRFGLEKDYPLEADIIISSGFGLDSQWRSVANAKAWLVETLHTFGVKLDTDGSI